MRVILCRKAGTHLMAPHSRSGSQVFLQCTTSQPISFLCRSNLRLRPSRSTPKFLCHLTSMIGCRSTSQLRRPFPNIALSIHTSHLSAIWLSTLPSALRCFMPPASLSNCLLIPSFQLCCTAPLISNVALHHLFLSINSRFLMLCSHIRYAAYWVCQGCILTGVWVIAHECGHGGFSPSDLVNDIVGSICHSFLLVPYWSWKFSHAKVPFFSFCSSFQKC